MHSVTFTDHKDKINEDLLFEFRDGADHTVKTGVKKVESQPTAPVQKAMTMKIEKQYF